MAKTPTNEFDTTKWLTEELGFTPEQAKALAPQFEPVKAKVAGGYLRQADYSRMSNDAKAETQRLLNDLKEKDAKLNREMAEWAALASGDESKTAALRGELETTKLEKYQLEQRIAAVAEEHGLDVTKILPSGKAPEPPAPVTKPAEIDTSKFVSREQFGGVVDYMLTVPAELNAIAQEHFDLTGERLDTRPLVAALKTRVNAKQPADLRQIWEETHQIPEKRTAAATAKYDQDIKDAEARGREAARSESQLPGQMPTGSHAPVFTRGHSESKLQRPQAGQATRGFAESLRSRKYAAGAPGGHK